jgi:hypothetical protein
VPWPGSPDANHHARERDKQPLAVTGSDRRRAQGTRDGWHHDALMRSDGEYARLFRTQAQGFLNPVT